MQSEPFLLLCLGEMSYIVLSVDQLPAFFGLCDFDVVKYFWDFLHMKFLHTSLTLGHPHLFRDNHFLLCVDTRASTGHPWVHTEGLEWWQRQQCQVSYASYNPIPIWFKFHFQYYHLFLCCTFIFFWTNPSFKYLFLRNVIWVDHFETRTQQQYTLLSVGME